MGPLRQPASEDARSGGASSDVKVITELEHNGEAGQGQGGSGFHYIDLDDDLSEEDGGGTRRAGTTEDYNLASEDTEYEAYFIEELFADEEELTSMYEESRAVFYQERRAAGRWTANRPARGLTQQLKQGVQRGRKLMDTLKQGARVRWPWRRQVGELISRLTSCWERMATCRRRPTGNGSRTPSGR